MGTLLFIISVILTVVLYPIGFIYTTIRFAIGVRFKTWLKRIDELLKAVAVAVDELGNVFMQEMFNDILIKKGGHEFGNGDETVSKVLGINKQSNTLTKAGKLLGWILNKIDPNHLEDSVNENGLN